jgi:hypothetical protein
MVAFVLEGAQQGFGTVKISGAGPLADSSLKTLIEAAAATQQPTALVGGVLDPKISGATVRIVKATTFFWENNGTAADATKMPQIAGEEIAIKKNNRELLGTIRVIATGEYDLRVMLW